MGWIPYGHGDRADNSFHLLLSDDELQMLKLLAEGEGLNASDYLRTLLRREAKGAGPERGGGGLRSLSGGRNDLKKLMRVARASATRATRAMRAMRKN